MIRNVGIMKAQLQQLQETVDAMMQISGSNSNRVVPQGQEAAADSGVESSVVKKLNSREELLEFCEKLNDKTFKHNVVRLSCLNWLVHRLIVCHKWFIFNFYIYI